MNLLKKAFSYWEGIKIPIVIYDMVLQLLSIHFFWSFPWIIDDIIAQSCDIIAFLLDFFFCCLLVFLCYALGLSMLRNKVGVSNLIVFMSFLLFLFYSIYLVNGDFAFDIVAIRLFAVLPLVANTAIWHLVFRNKYYDAKVIIMLFVSFFWGLYWCMGFGLYGFVVFAPMCVTTVLYVIWCVWRKKREVKRESEKNFKELMGEKENQSPLQ